MGRLATRDDAGVMTLAARLVRAAYSLLLRSAMPLYALRLLWRSRREPLYASHLGERFGFYRRASVPGALWIHAVSLGETRAAAPLIDALRRAVPALRIVLTHGTATGRGAGAALLRAGDAQAWLPWDTPGAARRFIAHFQPAAGVLVETEVWPNLLAAARAKALPMLLVNARMSERSRRRGRRGDALMRPAFASLSAVLAQSDASALRLREAGARAVHVLGNLKYDITPEPALLALGRRWKSGLDRPVVMAAQTRDGEEAALLAAWRASTSPRPLLLIVPRHPQRFDAVAELVVAAGFSLARRSAWTASPGDAPDAAMRAAEVWLGDSMLELPAYYALADVTLLGGSFEPLGGQNLIEAAACGCPIVMGPHTFNFAEAAALSLEAGAAVRVETMAQGVAAALAMLAAPGRDQRSRAASSFASAHRGAAERTAEEIVRRLPPTDVG